MLDKVCELLQLIFNTVKLVFDIVVFRYALPIHAVQIL